MNMPCGSALLGGLAEEEAELLQALGEDVFARHGEWQSGRRREIRKLWMRPRGITKQDEGGGALFSYSQWR